MTEKILDLKNQIANLIIECIEEEKKLPTEQEMMEMFSVSRFSLREVLSLFEANGVVVSQRGSGRVAQYPDLGKQIKNTWSIFINSKPTLLLDFMAIRQYLETSAIQKVVVSIHPEELLLLRECINNMKQFDTVSPEFSEADRNFHLILYKCLGNTILNQIISMYWDLCSESIIWPIIDSQESVRMHENILSALASGDASLAVEALQTHFEDTIRQITMALINK